MRVRSECRSGFTIIEMAISMAVMSVILLGLGLVTKSMISSYDEGMRQDRIVSKAHRTLDYIVGQLSASELGTLDPLPTSELGSAILSYRIPSGFDGTDVLWNEATRIEFQMAADELDDDLDNNGNGLVDEGTVTFLFNADLANEQRVVKARDVSEYLEGEIPNGIDDNDNGLVDEPGLVFFLDGEVLTIWLSLQQVGPADRAITRTVRTSVRLRN